MFNSFLFNSIQEYTISEIYSVCNKVTQSDDKMWLYADTIDREYVFMKSGDNWKLDHTWTHVLLGKKPG